MTKSRLDELRDAEIDYSLPINAFANKAKTLFNQMAKKHMLKTRIYAAEYNDDSAKLYVRSGYDSVVLFAAVLMEFEEQIWTLANEHKKLAKLNLPILSVTMGGGNINVNF